MAMRDDSDDYSLAFALRQKPRRGSGDDNDAARNSLELGFKDTVVEIAFTLCGFLGVIMLVTICLEALGLR